MYFEQIPARFTLFFMVYGGTALVALLAKQLAIDSGYRNYGTFNHAFKQRMGQSVTVWMRNKG